MEKPHTTLFPALCFICCLGLSQSTEITVNKTYNLLTMLIMHYRKLTEGAINVPIYLHNKCWSIVRALSLCRWFVSCCGGFAQFCICGFLQLFALVFLCVSSSLWLFCDYLLWFCTALCPRLFWVSLGSFCILCVCLVSRAPGLCIVGLCTD